MNIPPVANGGVDYAQIAAVNNLSNYYYQLCYLAKMQAAHTHPSTSITHPPFQPLTFPFYDPFPNICPMGSQIPQSYLQPYRSDDNSSRFTVLDELTLIDRIREGNRKNMTLSQIICGLADVNGHSAQEWFKFYLQQSSTINSVILSGHRTSYQHGGDLPQLGKRSKSRTAEDQSQHGRSRKRRQGQFNQHSRRKSAPSPLHAPIPPTDVVKSPKNRRKNMFTNADKKFFKDFFIYSLRKQPDIRNCKIYKRLAEKVPHHSCGSWASFAGKNKEFVKKIRLKYKNIDGHETHDSISADDGEDYSGENDEEASDNSLEASQASSQEDISEPETFLKRKGTKGSTPDKMLIAQFILKENRWDSPDQMSKWARFAREHPHRTAVTWNQYYQQNKLDINQIVGRLKAKTTQSSDRESSCRTESRDCRLTSAAA